MTGLLALETTEWNAWAIAALLITNAGAIYQLIRRERRSDNDQDATRDDSLVGLWRAWGKAMEKGRLEAEKKRHEAEERERKLIADVSRLTEQLRHGCEHAEGHEHGAE